MKWGDSGANNKNCGARVEGIGENSTTFSTSWKLVYSLLCWCNRSPASGHGVSRAYQEQEQQQKKATHCWIRLLHNAIAMDQNDNTMCLVFHDLLASVTDPLQ